MLLWTAVRVQQWGAHVVDLRLPADDGGAAREESEQRAEGLAARRVLEQLEHENVDRLENKLRLVPREVA